MILKDLLEVMSTYHFMIKVIGDNKVVDYMYDTNKPMGVGVDNMEVVALYASCEVEKPSEITKAVSVRPIIVVMVRKDA